MLKNFGTHSLKQLINGLIFSVLFFGCQARYPSVSNEGAVVYVDEPETEVALYYAMEGDSVKETYHYRSKYPLEVEWLNKEVVFYFLDLKRNKQISEKFNLRWRKISPHFFVAQFSHHLSVLGTNEFRLIYSKEGKPFQSVLMIENEFTLYLEPEELSYGAVCHGSKIGNEVLSGLENTTLSYFITKRNLPLPPHSVLKREMKWEMIVKDTLKKKDEEDGYVIRKASLIKSFHGKSYPIADTFFPLIRDYEELFYALSYFGESKYLKELEETSGFKKGFEQFWRGLGGEVIYTQKLIRTYFSRMESANRYFSTCQKGWNTDRGMVYMVLGAPHQVYFHQGREVWYYEKSNKLPAANFTFANHPNELCAKNIQLLRDPIFEEIWIKAIDLWRAGVIP